MTLKAHISFALVDASDTPPVNTDFHRANPCQTNHSHSSDWFDMMTDRVQQNHRDTVFIPSVHCLSSQFFIFT